MRRVVRFLPLIFLVIAGASARSKNTSDDKLDSILSQMQHAAGSIHTLQAKIFQKRVMGSIGGSEVYKGEFYFEHAAAKGGAPPKDRLRLKYLRDKTVTQDLLVDGDKIIFHQPLTNQALITSPEKQAGKRPDFGFIGSPYVSVPKLRSQYDVSYIKDEDVNSSRTSVLRLVPKIKSDVTEIDLWVDLKSYLPTQYQVHQANGDISTYTLSDVDTKRAIPGGTFVLHLPDGTVITRQ
jgi:outer membrane lipoprotein-sorting protein